jgi:hypothetical protein
MAPPEGRTRYPYSNKERHKPRIWFQHALFQEWEGVGVWDERNFPIKHLNKKKWHDAHQALATVKASRHGMGALVSSTEGRLRRDLWG